jgi:general stress protein 26
MKETEIKQLCLELMESAENVYLATIDKDGFPYVRSVFNLRNIKKFPALAGLFSKHNDDFLVYLSTNTSSEKVSQIKENPSVSVYYCISEKFRSLMLAGHIEFMEDMEIKKAIWQDGWEMYFPKGVKDPDYTVLRLLPLFARGWYESFAYEFKLRGCK